MRNQQDQQEKRPFFLRVDRNAHHEKTVQEWCISPGHNERERKRERDRERKREKESVCNKEECSEPFFFLVPPFFSKQEINGRKKLGKCASFSKKNKKQEQTLFKDLWWHDDKEQRELQRRLWVTNVSWFFLRRICYNKNNNSFWSMTLRLRRRSKKFGKI